MPTVTIANGGTYTRLTGERFGHHTGGGIRGRVSGFSRQSRKRLLDLLNQIKRDELQSGLFVTLTYPDLFSDEPARWHRDLDAFLKRLKRAYPGAVCIWRLEFKERLSGVNVGKIAPHFHIVALGIPRLSLRWLSRSWYEIVSSGDEKHLLAGTQAQRIRHRRGILYYCSKYMAKEATSPDFWTGRVWGVVGRELLAVVLVTYDLTWRQFYRLRRVLRSWLEKKTGRKAWAKLRGQGLTAYLADDETRRLLVWAAAAA